MKRTLTAGLIIVMIPLLASASQAAPRNTPADSGSKQVCGSPASGHVQCHARVVTKGGTSAPLATVGYQYGYAPSDLRSGYGLPSTGGTGQTIAVVDAYDDPTAEADLNVYRSQFGLGSCASADGCFTKVSQKGDAIFPSPDAGWAQEISLDLDMASAICPSCKILLVEASSSSFADLGAAVNKAAAMGATEISNSYGSSQEFSSETSYESSYYNHPGIAVTVSSGDSGYGRFGFPAASRYVTAVGGTSLKRDSSTRGWSESAWGSAGSGCSKYVAKPAWQHDSSCSHRTVSDVSAVADPYTGVAVYDSFGSSGGANWYVFGGTSVSAPIVAGVYALAGNASSVTYASYAYANTSSLWDVVSGKNGTCRTYLCRAGAGYDGPTGLGTPKGTGAF